MTEFSPELELSVAYFHTRQKVVTEQTQTSYESEYRTAHNMRTKEIWADEIAYCVDSTEADTEANVNEAITKYTLHTLTQISGSNAQTYYLNDSDEFMRPWIDPISITHETTYDPSYGFMANIYQEDNTLITPTEGRFQIDYYAGIVQFEEGFTPVDMGYGNIKVTCYVYVGGFSDTDYNFSFNRVHTHIVIPLYQQMIVHQGIELYPGGYLDVNGEIVLTGGDGL